MAAETNPFLDIGGRLAKLRKHYGLSQRDWAEKHGFSSSQYSNWEAGIRRIPIPCACMLSDMYGMDLDFIYRGRMDGISGTAAGIFNTL